MGQWKDYTKDAVEFATPYVYKAGAYMGETADRIGRTYRKKKRKLTWGMRLKRIHRVLSLVSNLMVIAASVATLFTLFQELLERRED